MLIGLGFLTGLGFGCVMSVMQIVVQVAAGPARLGAAAGTISVARGFGSTLGASVFGALIYRLIGGTQDLRTMHDTLLQTQVRGAFQVAFFVAAALCLLAAWTASRIPALNFNAGVDAGAPVVE